MGTFDLKRRYAELSQILMLSNRSCGTLMSKLIIPSSAASN